MLGPVRSSADHLQARLTADVQKGQGDLEAGKTALTQANQKHEAALTQKAMSDFTAAKAEFKAAGDTADGSSLLRYLEQVPVAGGQVHAKHLAIDYIADMGSELADAGIQLAKLDAQLIQPAAAGSAGRTLLTVIGETSQSLTAVRGNLVQAQADADRVDVTQLPGSQRATFGKAKAAIDSGLAGLDEFQQLVPVLNGVLGANGPQTYLVEQVNPAELRAGGGFIGSYTLLRADHGTLSVIKSGDSYELANPRPSPGQPGFIPQPTPYRETAPNVSWSFVDSNIYPDFPSNAKAAIQFAQPRVGTIDGVIAFDYYTVAKMLELTGPLAIPGFGVTVTATTLVPQLIKLDITGTKNHKSILAAMAGPLMTRMSNLSASQWPALITDLNAMATQRHLQAYLVNAAGEAQMDRYGWSGQINPAHASEFFMEVEDNYWGNKDNYYIKRHYTITFTREGNVLHNTITVDIFNPTPAGSYVRVEYKAILRLFMAGGATNAQSNLYPPAYSDPPPPSGFYMVHGWIVAPCCDGSGQGTITYDSPWSPNAAGAETIYWQKQPGTTTDMVDVVWNSGGGKYTTTGTFAQDTELYLSVNSVKLAPANIAAASLPVLSLG